jgi:hypothetical protein
VSKTKRIIAAVAVAFIVLSTLNYVYFQHNVQTIVAYIKAVNSGYEGGSNLTAQEWTDAQNVMGDSDTPRITYPGEIRWLLGRELVIILLCGNAILFVRNRFH